MKIQSNAVESLIWPMITENKSEEVSKVFSGGFHTLLNLKKQEEDLKTGNEGAAAMLIMAMQGQNEVDFPIHDQIIEPSQIIRPEVSFSQTEKVSSVGKVAERSIQTGFAAKAADLAECSPKVNDLIGKTQTMNLDEIEVKSTASTELPGKVNHSNVFRSLKVEQWKGMDSDVYDPPQYLSSELRSRPEVVAFKEEPEKLVNQTEPLKIETMKELETKLPQRLIRAVESGREELKVQLEPHRLGRIEIKIVYDQKQVHVSVSCSEEKTLKVLTQSADEMAALLEARLRRPLCIMVDVPKMEQPAHQNDTEGNSQQHHSNERQQQGRESESEQSGGEDFIQRLRLNILTESMDQ